MKFLLLATSAIGLAMPGVALAQTQRPPSSDTGGTQAQPSARRGAWPCRVEDRGARRSGGWLDT